jgi:hypothetical protein
MMSTNQAINDSMAIIRATSYTRKIAAAKATIRYNQHRAGKDGERKSRELFDLDGSLGRIAAYEMIDQAEKGTVYFRFVISPDRDTEDTRQDLDLKALTRQTLLALQEQLGLRVPFAAAIHDDHTDNRHVHLVACVTSRLGTEHFKTMREAATETALSQRQDPDPGALLVRAAPAHAARLRLPGVEEHGERRAHPPEHEGPDDLVQRPLVVVVALFDRRQLSQVALDARGEVVVLGLQDAEVRLAPPPFALAPAFEAEPLRESRPFGGHEHRHSAGK